MIKSNELTKIGRLKIALSNSFSIKSLEERK